MRWHVSQILWVGIGKEMPFDSHHRIFFIKSRLMFIFLWNVEDRKNSSIEIEFHSYKPKSSKWFFFYKNPIIWKSYKIPPNKRRPNRKRLSPRFINKATTEHKVHKVSTKTHTHTQRHRAKIQHKRTEHNTQHRFSCGHSTTNPTQPQGTHRQQAAAASMTKES